MNMPLIIILATAGFSHAATILSSSFNPLTNGAVITTGLADWGYASSPGSVNNGLFNGSAGPYNNLAYGSLDNSTGQILTTVSGSSSIGAVTVTEGQGADGNTGSANITFDGIQAYGGFRSVGAIEDMFTLILNDLGIGTFDITLFLGHSSASRTFRMDYTLSDGITNPSASTNSGTIGSLGSTVVYSTGVAFTYDITVTTTAATDDLTLNLFSTAGGSGDGIWAGYTVAAVPEPASVLMGSMGALLLLMRRRRA